MPRRASCPLVMVDWEDSTQPVAKWRFLTDVPRDESPHLCRSVGWLIVDTKKTKVLAPNFGAINAPEQLQVSGTITIPARAIRRIVKLREPK